MSAPVARPVASTQLEVIPRCHALPRIKSPLTTYGKRGWQ